MPCLDAHSSFFFVRANRVTKKNFFALMLQENKIEDSHHFN